MRRILSDSERSWIGTAIAKALETLGIEVTPRSMEMGFAQLDAMTSSRVTNYVHVFPPDPPRIIAAPDGLDTLSDYTPPDPYKADLERLRVPSPRWPEPTPAPTSTNTGYTPPDPWAEGLEKMRKENR